MIRVLPFYFFFTVLILLIDIYAFQAVRSASSSLSPQIKQVINIIYWCFTLLAISTLTAAVYFFPFDKWPPILRMVLSSFIIVVYLAKLLMLPIIFFDDIFRGITWVLRTISDTKPTDGSSLPPISRSKFLGQVAMVVG